MSDFLCVKGLAKVASLGLLAVFLVQACAVNPVTGRQDFVMMSEAQEIELGQAYHREILKQYARYDDEALQSYVNAVGQRLAKESHRGDLKFHFTVLDSPDVNAFALPGGYVYITRGIMAYLNSEAELAGVLGHEIGHVTARHSVRQQSTSAVTGLLGAIIAASAGIDPEAVNVLGTAIVRGYGREHELEADRLGAEYLGRLGYDPEHMIGVVRVLKNQELYEKARAEAEGREYTGYHGLFSTHPDNDKRLQEVIQAAKQHAGAVTQDENERGYKSQLEGMVFGSGEKEGVVRGQRFYHKPLNASITAPAGWSVLNQPQQLLFVSPEKDALIHVSLKNRGKNKTPQAFLRSMLGRAVEGQGETLSKAGMPGYSTTIVVEQTPFGRRPVRYVVWFKNEQTWLFASVAKELGGLDLYEPDIMGSVKSLRALTATEKTTVRPLRIQLLTADASTRYEALAQKFPAHDVTVQRLRLLNSDYPDQEPEPGQQLKIIQ
ncbi:MAG TPA: hypothetical protein DCZ12_17415 [Gammaproteobacteria bacterium]|nr:hypothetical protein [Gammaproteobacteria bacterium]